MQIAVSELVAGVGQVVSVNVSSLLKSVVLNSYNGSEFLLFQGTIDSKDTRIEDDGSATVRAIGAYYDWNVSQHVFDRNVECDLSIKPDGSVKFNVVDPKDPTPWTTGESYLPRAPGVITTLPVLVD